MKNAGDCPAMTAALHGYVEANRAVFAEAKAQKGTEEEARLLMERYGSRIEAATERMIPGIMDCQSAADELQRLM